MEEPIQLYNVRMVQIHLYLYFSYQRLLNVLLLNFGFGYGFDGAQKIRRFAPSHEYLAIFALA